MTRFVAVAMAVAAMTLLAGCATESMTDSELENFELVELPSANITLNIPGLGPCTDNPDRSLRLNTQQPVNVLVHGCFGSSGNFRGLAQVLAFHGQQTACFTYNDRDSMMLSSAQLNSALDQLAPKMANPRVTVIGHSQGALIARKALVANRPDAISNPALRLRLVTVSGPFAGIASAHQCGDPLTRVLTFGLIGPICKIVTGDKWSEITYNSPFILQPGALHGQVDDYLKVVTDENGSCRRSKDGVCLESDEIFSLQEQRNAAVDSDPLVKIAQVKAGHVEIVGDKRVAPVKLIAILQQNGVIEPTEPERTAKLKRLLSHLYGAAN
ncbi:MAG: alpha/beta hydrolase [Polaromonas sp.]